MALQEPPRASPGSFHGPILRTTGAIVLPLGLLECQVSTEGSFQATKTQKNDKFNIWCLRASQALSYLLYWWRHGNFLTLKYCAFARQGSRRPFSWSIRTSCCCSASQYRRVGIQQSFRTWGYRVPTNQLGMNDLFRLGSQVPNNLECHRMSRPVNCPREPLQDQNLSGKRIRPHPWEYSQVSSHGRWFACCADDQEPWQLG